MTRAVCRISSTAWRRATKASSYRRRLKATDPRLRCAFQWFGLTLTVLRNQSKARGKSCCSTGELKAPHRFSRRAAPRPTVGLSAHRPVPAAASAGLVPHRSRQATSPATRRPIVRCINTVIRALGVERPDHGPQACLRLPRAVLGGPLPTRSRLGQYRRRDGSFIPRGSLPRNATLSHPRSIGCRSDGGRLPRAG